MEYCCVRNKAVGAFGPKSCHTQRPESLPAIAIEQNLAAQVGGRQNAVVDAAKRNRVVQVVSDVLFAEGVGINADAIELGDQRVLLPIGGEDVFDLLS